MIYHTFIMIYHQFIMFCHTLTIDLPRCLSFLWGEDPFPQCPPFSNDDWVHCDQVIAIITMISLGDGIWGLENP